MRPMADLPIADLNVSAQGGDGGKADDLKAHSPTGSDRDDACRKCSWLGGVRL
jgi:hypothetical protein